MSKELATRSASMSLENLTTISKSIAKSGMFGVKNEDQALSLMLLCQAEGLHPVLALRRYHIIENKPSMRADALQGEFEQDGAILWHERTEKECSATFFADKKKVTKSAITRAKNRYKAMCENKPTAEFAEPGELTIVRTFADAVEKKVACTWKVGANNEGKYVLKHNWKQSPRQMLHARCLSEGVRAIAPGLIAGVYTEDEIIDIAANEKIEAATPKELVTRATANRAARNGNGDGEPEVIEGEIVSNDEPEAVIEDVTVENYKEVVCHIGKAEGPMLEKKIGELHPNILNWLSSHYGEGEGTRWGNPPTAKDERLKKAIDIAINELQADKPPQFNGEFHEKLYNLFDDEWSREDFIESMSEETDSFPKGVTKFAEIPEEYAKKCVENFDAVAAIIKKHAENKKSRGSGKTSTKRSERSQTRSKT